MRFIRVFIIFMFLQTTTTFSYYDYHYQDDNSWQDDDNPLTGFKCVYCNDYNDDKTIKCHATAGDKFLRVCQSLGDKCYVRYDQTKQEVSARSCITQSEIDRESYALNGCKVDPSNNGYTHCTCSTDGCNSITFPSQIAYFTSLTKMKCIDCIGYNPEETNQCLVTADPKFLRTCANLRDVCYVGYESNKQEVTHRNCVSRTKVIESYVLNGCKHESRFENWNYIDSTHCTCNSNDGCNDKTFPSQIAGLTNRKCIDCPHSGPNQVDCLLYGGPSYSQDCTGKGWICTTHIDASTLLVTSRGCLASSIHNYYTIDKWHWHDRYSYYTYACQTTNCNNKTPPEMIPEEFPELRPAPSVDGGDKLVDTNKNIAVSKPEGLMCYQCLVSTSSNCLNIKPTGNTFLKKCAEYRRSLDSKDGVQVERVLVSTKGDDFYCTTEYVNDKPVSRGCKRKMYLPNSVNPKKCHKNGTSKFCACKKSKCNYHSSFFPEAQAYCAAGAHKGFFIGILTSTFVLSLVK